VARKQKDGRKEVSALPVESVLIRPPKKSLGQHFLKENAIIDNIIRLAHFDESDIVLEIGPGRGALTIPLAGKVKTLVAVEKDEELAEELKRKLSLGGILNVTVVAGDILKWDFKAMPCSGGRFHAIGNLPYNISKPVLERLMVNRDLMGRALLMLQKEVAARVTASPGGKTYGALSVFVQYHARASTVLHVGCGSFFPRPKVDSTVIELDFKSPFPLRALDDYVFTRVVKGAFAHRRKTILNSLGGYFPLLERVAIAEALERAGISPASRAESLCIEDFLRLASTMDLTIT